MSFLFELEVDDLTEAQARSIVARAEASGVWPLGWEVRARRRYRLFGPVVERRFELRLPDQIDRERHILTDDAIWDAPAWDMRPDLLPLLAGTIRLLGEELSQGFAFRATWVGSPVHAEVVTDAEGLAEIVLASGLNEFTRYRVTSG